MYRITSTAIAALIALGSTGLAFAQAKDDSGHYIPRSERDNKSTMTFIGNKNGLKIIDHKTGEVVRYAPRKSSALAKLSEEARARDEERYKRQQEEAEAMAAADAEAEAEAAAASAEGEGDGESGGEAASESSDE